MRKANLATLLLIMLMSAGCANTTTTTPATTEVVQVEQTVTPTAQTSVGSEELVEKLQLVGIPYVPGSIDLLNTAVRYGGHTTYDVISDLIGVRVEQVYSDGVLVKEIITPDGGNFRYSTNDVDTAVGVEITKTNDKLVANYTMPLHSSRAEFLLDSMQIFDDILRGETENALKQGKLTYFNVHNEYGEVKVENHDNITVTVNNSNNDENFLMIHRDIITDRDFWNKLSEYGVTGYHELELVSDNNNSQEVEILDTGSENEHLLKLFEENELVKKTFTVRYAPPVKRDAATDEELELIDDFNQWKINNFSIVMHFHDKTDGSTWKYSVVLNSDNNLYSDKRDAITGVWSKSLDKDSLDKIVQEVYWEGAHELVQPSHSPLEDGYKERVGYSPEDLESDTGEIGYYHTIYDTDAN